MKTVSVCVPVLNGARFLEETLRSIAGQKEVDLEIVVGDNQSTDGTLDIARRVRDEFPDISWKIISNTERLDMVANWNSCVRAASGEYVKLTCHDDLLYPDCLKVQSAELSRSSEVALCACGCDICSASGKKIFKRKRRRLTGVYDGGEMIADCLHIARNLVGEPVTTLFRKEDFERIGGFDPSMKYYADLDLWLRLLAGMRFAFVEQAYSGFRVHRGAGSFFLQGEGYAEFLRLEQKIPHSEGLVGAQRVFRRMRAARDSLARLVVYQIFG